MEKKSQSVIEVRGLDLSYDDYAVLRGLNFSVAKGDIFVVMGGSGCGKSTLLKVLIGLKEPAKGEVFYGGINFWQEDETVRQGLMRRFPGVNLATGKFPHADEVFGSATALNH